MPMLGLGLAALCALLTRRKISKCYEMPGTFARNDAKMQGRNRFADYFTVVFSSRDRAKAQ
jgi:hypothetical protein